jgi:hypothetical protein
MALRILTLDNSKVERSACQTGGEDARSFGQTVVKLVVKTEKRNQDSLSFQYSTTSAKPMLVTLLALGLLYRERDKGDSNKGFDQVFD